MKKLLCWWFVCLTLTGCASLPSQQSALDSQAVWTNRVAELSLVKRWQLSGRMSIRDNEEVYRASMHWVRNQMNHTIDFTGPFGRRYAQLHQDQRGATLYDKNRKAYRARNVQRLLYKTLGWRVPLQGMNYWILGVPVPGQPKKQQLDQRGRLSSLHQLGWQIRFLEYRRHGDHDLPRKLFLRRVLKASKADNSDGVADEHKLEVRLVINRWKIQ